MKRGRRIKAALRRVRARYVRAARRERRQRRALAFRRARTAALLKEWKATGGLPALKRYRASRALAARSRAEVMQLDRVTDNLRAKKRVWHRAYIAWRKAQRNPYPHLRGDLDADADVLRKAECLGKKLGVVLLITSGNRTDAEQLALWNNRHNNPFPVAFCCPCQSNHCGGRALDIVVNGLPIQNAVSAATIRSCGLSPLIGDEVHVEG